MYNNRLNDPTDVIPPPLLLAHLGVWLCAALVLASAVLVVTLGNLFRAALSLGVVLIGIAGLFILVGAEFLAFVQILVYVGAILTLVIFAIMLTVRVQGQQASAGSRRWPAAVASTALFLLLASVVRVVAPDQVPGGAPVTLPQLGRELVTTLMLPFEVISVVFVAAIVGAIAIASTKVHRPQSTVHSDGK